MLQMQQFTEELDGTLKRMARTLEGKQRETGMRLESATRHLALLDYRKTLERGIYDGQKEWENGHFSKTPARRRNCRPALS